MVQGNPDATPAQERVFFLDGKIGQGLVAADVQGTHGHRVGREGFQLLPIVFPLLLLGWEAILDHKRHFGAVQANTFRTMGKRPQYIGHQAGIHQQRDPVAVGGFTGLVPQGFQATNQLVFFIAYRLVEGPQIRRGRGENLPFETVDYQFPAIQLVNRNIHQAHHRGHTHGPGQDGYVGVTGAFYGYQPHKLAFGHFPEHGRSDFVTDQYRMLGIFQMLLLTFLQM